MAVQKAPFNKRWARNAIFFVLLCLVFFTDLPKWVSTQFTRLTLKDPEMEAAGSDQARNIFVSDGELLSASGEKMRLTDFKGRPMVINFWASWCVPCLAEFPSILELRDEVGDEAAFLFITREPEEKFQAFLEGRENTADFYKQLSKMPKPLAHSAIPATFIVNASGDVVFSKSGAADWSDEATVEKVRSLLRE